MSEQDRPPPTPDLLPDVPSRAEPWTPPVATMKPGTRRLAVQWRSLDMVANAVALVSIPSVWLYYSKVRDLRTSLALLATLGTVALFRGTFDILGRRLIPWPNLFGAEHQLIARDVQARRRAATWRFVWRLVWWFGIVPAVAIAAIGVFTGHGSDIGDAFGRIGDFWSARRDLFSTNTISLLLQISVFFLANVLLIMGPLLLLGVSQIKAFEPGDASWGVRFDDVRGQKDVKAEVQRVVQLWQAGEDYEAAGGKRERGLLFVGPPGTGKTMLAKALATSFNAPFVTVPGSGFGGVFMGLDVIAVRWLGWKAKRLARKWGGQCIVFIDEIDALGSRRSGMAGAGGFAAPGLLPSPSSDFASETRAARDHLFYQRHAPTAAPRGMALLRRIDHYIVPGQMGSGGSGALNQLLVMMDGIDSPRMLRRLLTRFGNTVLDAVYLIPARIGRVSLRLPRPQPERLQIFFIGATNLPDSLDPALTRPGRLGRTVLFRTPHKRDRLDILGYYLDKVAHDPALDADGARDELARLTAFFSPAMIEQSASLALAKAHQEGRDAFDRDDILTMMAVVTSGTVVDFEYTPDELWQVALHEAGHACVAHVYQGTTHEHARLTIRMRSSVWGSSGGHFLNLERDERFVHFRKEVFADLLVTMGALATEMAFFGLGENTQGVGGDMGMVVNGTARMIGSHAMGPPRVTFDRELTADEERQARLRLSRYLQRTGRRIVALASTDEHSLRVLGSRGKGDLADEMVGHLFLIAYTFAVQNREAIRIVADVLVEKRELYGEEISRLMNSVGLVAARVDYLDEQSWPIL